MIKKIFNNYFIIYFVFLVEKKGDPIYKEPESKNSKILSVQKLIFMKYKKKKLNN